MCNWADSSAREPYHKEGESAGCFPMFAMDSILVVDPVPESRERIEAVLVSGGYHATGADSLETAKESLRSQHFHLILASAALETYHLEDNAGTPILRFSAGADISPDWLRREAAAIISERFSEQREQALREELQDGCGWLVFREPAMIAVLNQIRRCAATDAPVCICGEPGTGRCALARLLHSWSSHAAGPFVDLRAAGQLRRRMLAAGGGTLFAHNVDRFQTADQAALLALIRQGWFSQSTDGHPARGDVRLVVTATGSIEEKTRAGSFHPDLAVYLLNNAVRVPPLRERRQDIVPLAQHFLERACGRLERPVPRLARSAAGMLLSHGWPGNAVELEAVMTRAALAAGEFVETAHLQLDCTPASLRLSGVERDAIERALQSTGGNRTRAARLLGISVRTLQYRLKDYGAGRAAPGRQPRSQA